MTDRKQEAGAAAAKSDESNAADIIEDAAGQLSNGYAVDFRDVAKQVLGGSKARIAELERIADDLQALCDKQALMLGERDAQLEAVGAGGVGAMTPKTPVAAQLRSLDEARGSWSDWQPHSLSSALAGGFRDDIEVRLLYAAQPAPEVVEPAAIGAGHLFEFWWAEYMPEATQDRAWKAWQDATNARNVGVAAPQPQQIAEPKCQESPADAWLRGHIAGLEKAQDVCRIVGAQDTNFEAVDCAYAIYEQKLMVDIFDYMPPPVSTKEPS